MVQVIKPDLSFLKNYHGGKLEQARYIPVGDALSGTQLVDGVNGNKKVPVSGLLISHELIALVNAKHGLATVIHQKGLVYKQSEEIQFNVVYGLLKVWAGNQRVWHEIDLKPEEELSQQELIAALRTKIQRADPIREVPSYPDKVLTDLTNSDTRRQAEIPPKECNVTIDGEKANFVVLTKNRLILGNREKDVWTLIAQGPELANLFAGEPTFTFGDARLIVLRRDETDGRAFELKKHYTRPTPELEPEAEKAEREEHDPLPPASSYNLTYIAGGLLFSIALLYTARSCYLNYWNPPTILK